MVNSRSITILCVGALVLAGCSSKKPDDTKPNAVGSNSPKPGVDSPIPEGLLPSPPEFAEPSEPPPKGSKGWTKTELAAAQLADEVAGAMANLNGVYGEARTLILTAAGKGQHKSVIRIADAKHFHVDYFVGKEAPSSASLKSDGTTKASFSGKGVTDQTPVGTASADANLTDTELVEKWPYEFSRLMFRGLVDGKDAWKPVLMGLARGEGGFETTVEKRERKVGDKTVRNFRVLAVRKASSAKKLGECTIEMVFDADRKLPVTIRVDRKDAKGSPYRLHWSAGWNFNQKFDAKVFQFAS